MPRHAKVIAGACKGIFFAVLLHQPPLAPALGVAPNLAALGAPLPGVLGGALNITLADQPIHS